MANILFIESDTLAVKAFSGIINRSAHKMVHAKRLTDAWKHLVSGPFFHLAVLEIKLSDGSGAALLPALASQPFLAAFPVLVYSRAQDRDTIRKITGMGVQNYLVKPYDDEKLFAEVSKAANNPWWKTYFEPAEKILAHFDPPAASVCEVHAQLIARIKNIQDRLGGWSPEIAQQLAALRKASEEAGFPRFTSMVDTLMSQDSTQMRAQLQAFHDQLPLALRLLEESATPGKLSHLEPEIVHSEETATSDAPERKPTGQAEDLFGELAQLPGYPVMDSVAASFQMAASNAEIEVETLASMILTDPCLSVEVFYHVNHVSELSRKTEDGVRDQKHAIQLLGLSRIRTMASSLLTMPDTADQSGSFDWRSYRSFQIGCGLLAEDLVGMLSLQLNPSMAYFAGLVHQLGKVLFLHLYPTTYAKALAFSKGERVPIHVAEKQYFGCSHEKAGAFFAEQSKFPFEIVDSILYYRDPASAPRRSATFCALIALSHHLCLTYGVGNSGGLNTPASSSLASTPAWELLREQVGPAFSLTRFEIDCRNHIQGIQRQVSGLSQMHIPQ